jgi:hypothetical protein
LVPVSISLSVPSTGLASRRWFATCSVTDLDFGLALPILLVRFEDGQVFRLLDVSYVGP